MTILAEILVRKKEEVASASRSLSALNLEQEVAGTPPPPDFQAALRNQVHPCPRLIAEVKQRSPSKGVLCADFNPLKLAEAYAANGAAAISVLTDEHFFGGSLYHLSAIAALEMGIPLLRKDFIFDRYQLLQARAAGASAALLIVAMLVPAQLAELLSAAADLQIAALVEVHTASEIEVALSAGADIIGINNRNLHTFETSLDVTAALRPHVPPKICVVAESGIRTRADIQTLATLAVDAVLIGEGLVTSPDVCSKVREFAQMDSSKEVG